MAGYDVGLVERRMYAMVELALGKEGGPATRAEQSMAVVLADGCALALREGRVGACERLAGMWASERDIAYETALAAHLATSVVQAVPAALGSVSVAWDESRPLPYLVDRLLTSCAEPCPPGTYTVGFSPMHAGSPAIRVSTGRGTLVASPNGDPGIYDGIDVDLETRAGIAQLALAEVAENRDLDDVAGLRTWTWDGTSQDSTGHVELPEELDPEVCYQDGYDLRDDVLSLMPRQVEDVLSDWSYGRWYDDGLDGGRPGPLVTVDLPDGCGAALVFDFRGRPDGYATLDGWADAAARGLDALRAQLSSAESAGGNALADALSECAEPLCERVAALAGTDVRAARRRMARPGGGAHV